MRGAHIACIAAVCVVLVVIILVVYFFARPKSEDFTSVPDKALVLSEWLTVHPGAQYTEFISANPDSNIVEYAHLRKLQASGTSMRDQGAVQRALRL